MPDENFYTLLGVKPDASKEEITKMYRKLAKELHPDKTNDAPALTQKFKLVGEAYSVLIDDEKRVAYDRANNYNYNDITHSYRESMYAQEEEWNAPSTAQEEINKAAMYGDIASLKEFVARKVKLESESNLYGDFFSYGYSGSPLHYAVRGQQVDTVKWLLSHGVNINYEPYKTITLALDTFNSDIVATLLNADKFGAAKIKVNVNKLEFINETALMHICGVVSMNIASHYSGERRKKLYRETVNMAKMLLEHGAEVDQVERRDTALMNAISSRNDQLISFLLEHGGANINMNSAANYYISHFFSSGIDDNNARYTPLGCAVHHAITLGFDNWRDQWLNTINTLLTAKIDKPLTPQSLKSVIKMCESVVGASCYAHAAHDIKILLKDYLNANYSYRLITGYKLKSSIPTLLLPNDSSDEKQLKPSRKPK
jgi:hypothetical protein